MGERAFGRPGSRHVAEARFDRTQKSRENFEIQADRSANRECRSPELRNYAGHPSGGSLVVRFRSACKPVSNSINADARWFADDYLLLQGDMHPIVLSTTPAGVKNGRSGATRDKATSGQ